jgi:hypothetical protein
VEGKSARRLCPNTETAIDDALKVSKQWLVHKGFRLEGKKNARVRREANNAMERSASIETIYAEQME